MHQLVCIFGKLKLDCSKDQLFAETFRQCRWGRAHLRRLPVGYCCCGILRASRHHRAGCRPHGIPHHKERVRGGGKAFVSQVR